MNRNIGHGGSCAALCAMNIYGMFKAHIVDIRHEGTINARMYEQWLVANVLNNMNRFPLPNSVLIMDGSLCHNKRRIGQYCEQRGILCLSLPAYSPDFNPLEFAFHSVHSTCRRNYHEQPQHNEAELRPIFQHALWNSVTGNQACNYFEHCLFYVTDEERELANLINPGNVEVVV